MAHRRPPGTSRPRRVRRPAMRPRAEREARRAVARAGLPWSPAEGCTAEARSAPRSSPDAPLELSVVDLAAHGPRERIDAADTDGRVMHGERSREVHSEPAERLLVAGFAEDDDHLVRADDGDGPFATPARLDLVEIHAIPDDLRNALRSAADVQIAVRIETPEIPGMQLPA